MLFFCVCESARKARYFSIRPWNLCFSLSYHNQKNIITHQKKNMYSCPAQFPQPILKWKLKTDMCQYALRYYASYLYLSTLAKMSFCCFSGSESSWFVISSIPIRKHGASSAWKSESIWGHKMAGPENMSDASVVGPNKSLLTEWLDPVLVPDLDSAQATGQGSTLHGHEPNTHMLYWE